MTTSPPTKNHIIDQQSHATQPWCSRCDSDKHLVVESIGPLSPTARDLVEIEYSCAECESFYAHQATVCQTASLLQTDTGVPGVLRFGHEYFHCGEVMQPAGDDDRPWKLADVVNADSTLRCRCGFRLVRPL